MTTRNTTRNRAPFNRHEIVVVHVDGPRPPSPTASLRRSGSTPKASREDRAKKRLALRGDLPAEPERPTERTSKSTPPPPLLKRPHMVAPGDEGVFESPVKRAKGASAAPSKGVRWDRGLVRELSTPAKPLPSRAASGKAAKPVLAKVRSHRSMNVLIAAQTVPLDREGNVLNAKQTLSPIVPRSEVRIVKTVYEEED